MRGGASSQIIGYLHKRFPVRWAVAFHSAGHPATCTPGAIGRGRSPISQRPSSLGRIPKWPIYCAIWRYTRIRIPHKRIFSPSKKISGRARRAALAPAGGVAAISHLCVFGFPICPAQKEAGRHSLDQIYKNKPAGTPVGRHQTPQNPGPCRQKVRRLPGTPRSLSLIYGGPKLPASLITSLSGTTNAHLPSGRPLNIILRTHRTPPRLAIMGETSILMQGDNMHYQNYLDTI